MEKEWFLTSELVGVHGLPSSTQGINKRARAEEWIKRKPEGVQGRAFEYHIDSLPKEAQQALRGNQAKRKSTELVEMITIPFYEVYASAGSGVIPFEHEYSDFSIDIHPQVLFNHGVVSTKRLFAMPVKGDSMEPSLFEGDTVIVRRIDTPLVLEGVFVIRIGSELFIKRIQFNKFEGYMQVDSDNSYYRSYTLKGNDLNEVTIIGEALCVLGRVRRIKQPASQPASKG